MTILCCLYTPGVNATCLYKTNNTAFTGRFFFIFVFSAVFCKWNVDYKIFADGWIQNADLC